jgi:hypothetical protein
MACPAAADQHSWLVIELRQGLPAFGAEDDGPIAVHGLGRLSRLSGRLQNRRMPRASRALVRDTPACTHGQSPAVALPQRWPAPTLAVRFFRQTAPYLQP